MTKKDWSDIVKEKVKNYLKDQIIFTKYHLVDWLCIRNKFTVEEMKEEVLNSKYLVFTERQEVEYEGVKEVRFRCYFVYSRNRGRCYILRFNHQIKIITVFPLGRTTLKRYRRRFK